MLKYKGFTLVELLLVITVVGILAAVALPIFRSRIDSAKWSEANAAAGTIRTAVRAYFAEKGSTAATALKDKTLDDSTTQAALGFSSSDLTGTYFTPAKYKITDVTSFGIAEITVSAGTGLSGSYKLETDGDWVKQ